MARVGGEPRPRVGNRVEGTLEGGQMHHEPYASLDDLLETGDALAARRCPDRLDVQGSVRRRTLGIGQRVLRGGDEWRRRAAVRRQTEIAGLRLDHARTADVRRTGGAGMDERAARPVAAGDRPPGDRLRSGRGRVGNLDARRERSACSLVRGTADAHRTRPITACYARCAGGASRRHSGKTAEWLILGVGFCSPAASLHGRSLRQTGQARDATIRTPIPRDHRRRVGRLLAVRGRTATSPTCVRRLLDEPGPLCTALIALSPDDRTRRSAERQSGDRARAATTSHAARLAICGGIGRRAVDLAWYLVWTRVSRLTVARETTIAWYRDALARRLGVALRRGLVAAATGTQFARSIAADGLGNAWDAARGENAATSAWAREELAWLAGRVLAAERWLA